MISPILWKTLRRVVWPPSVLFALVLLTWIATVLYGDVIITRVVTLALLNMILVIGLFTYSGNSGMMSFGHISFAAIGAYTTAYLTIPPTLKATLFPDMPSFLSWLLVIHTTFPLALVVSGGVAALFALILAPPIVRLPALQGAIVTLALLLIVHTVLRNWTEVTRGQSAMIGMPGEVGLVEAALGAFAAIVIAWALTISNPGLRLRASREDQIAARAVGISLARDRTVAWVVSAFILGFGGGMFADFIATFSPDQFFLLATFTIIAMLIIGGTKSLAGAVVGALVFSGLAEILRRVQRGDVSGIELPAGAAEMLLALFILVIIIKRPQGVTGGREIPFPQLPRRRAATRS